MSDVGMALIAFGLTTALASGWDILHDLERCNATCGLLTKEQAIDE